MSSGRGHRGGGQGGYRGGSGGQGGYRGGSGGQGGYQGGQGGHQGERGGVYHQRSDRHEPHSQMQGMHINERGRGGYGGGGRGVGGFRGGDRGGGFSRGGGRSMTRVNFETRIPKGQNEIRPEYPNQDAIVWKPFDPEQERAIELPARKPENRTIRVSSQEVEIVLNHFPVDIKLPNKIYGYRVDIERKRGPEPLEAGKKAKPKQKGKSQRKSDGAEEAAGHVRMLPADLRKRILRHVIPDMQTRYGREYGVITDYSASIYTIKQLQLKGLPLEFDVNSSDFQREDAEDDIFTIKISGPTEQINTANLAIDVNNMRGRIVSGELVNLERVYSTLIRCVKMNAYTPMKRSYLIDFTQQPHPLGGGVVSYQGYDIMMPLANGWKKFVQIEMANLAAYLHGPVKNVLCDLFRDERDQPNPMDVKTWKPVHGKKANDLLKSCKIVYQPTPARKFGKVVTGVLRQSVSEVTFTHEGKETSVFDYFRRQYGIQLRYPNGPCIECKGHNAPKIPAEICILKDGQSFNRKLDENQVTKMAEKSRLVPSDLQPAIQSAVQNLRLNDNPILQAYGMSMTSGGKMHQIKTKVLTPPELCYGGKKGSHDGKKGCIVPDKGEWDIWSTEFEFFRNCTVKKWGILNLAAGGYRGVTNDQAYDFARKMSVKGGMRGIELDANPQFYVTANLNENDRDINVKQLSDIFAKFRNHVGDKDLAESFILVILPKKGTAIYNHVKQAAELKVGILTQCIVGANMTNPKRLESICGNLWLKINSKLTKVNHVPLPPPNFKECFKIFDYPTIIIGADVTHPPPGSSQMRMVGNEMKEVGPPSFAAITASIDRTGMPYMMHVQAQEKANKGAAEVIHNLDVVVGKFLKMFSNRTGKVKPCRIIYYRDGVGEGQFQEVLRTEMSAIRRACQNLNSEYKPAITFVTVQKRHKTRFFCKAGNSYENAPPGTVVDIDIVHPTETDFYLLSHKGLLGTSRPTRYHVLWDDFGFSMEELQIMSYFLCYMFVRCNRSVKVPAPTYYAHWAAKRAEVLSKGVCESMYGDVGKINAQLNGGTREVITNNFPMHFV